MSDFKQIFMLHYFNMPKTLRTPLQLIIRKIMKVTIVWKCQYFNCWLIKQLFMFMMILFIPAWSLIRINYFFICTVYFVKYMLYKIQMTQEELITRSESYTVHSLSPLLLLRVPLLVGVLWLLWVRVTLGWRCLARIWWLARGTTLGLCRIWGSWVTYKNKNKKK